jgi:hypothetical protein
MQICKEDLKKINKKSKGDKYVDESAAMAKRVTAEKRELQMTEMIWECWRAPCW